MKWVLIEATEGLFSNGIGIKEKKYIFAAESSFAAIALVRYPNAIIIY